VNALLRHIIYMPCLALGEQTLLVYEFVHSLGPLSFFHCPLFSLSVDSRGRMHTKGFYEFNIAFLDCRKSSRINTTLAVTGLTPLLIARLDHQDAIARLNLLKLIKVSYFSSLSLFMIHFTILLLLLLLLLLCAL
jgi:hypothetical protein